MSLSEKVVLVTGATGGLGPAVVRHFKDQGAQVVAMGRSMESLNSHFANSNISRKTCDLLNAEEVKKCVEDVIAEKSRIDILVCVAGGFAMGSTVYETPMEQWELMNDLNVKTVLNMVREVIPGMLEQKAGKVITVGATAAHHGMAQMGTYCASKSALMRFTEALAMEVRTKGINVNAVLPTIIDTPDNRNAMPDADYDRWVAPEDLANVIGFLTSDAAKAVHGALIPVTGLS
ncbi:SDR family NAD(P)-dependent oxidoreductase [Hahella ganghwensis]|uniref:SDR family NAD(P)-dependent oxidoreductase n=1 Tax=Hahella ganghwensis TaxID=286420 RepID=UPI0003742CEA|nr:SDR family NAD(P)-dependent oxidoreductase [Hahella ganghwensis]